MTLKRVFKIVRHLRRMLTVLVLAVAGAEVIEWLLAGSIGG